MREISLHILDIAQNAISAGADSLRVAIIEDISGDRLVVRIKDDGCGMDAVTLERAQDPFYTSRTTRKVGLGIPMFKASAEITNGSFRMDSQPGIGTDIEAVYQHSHIDRMPLGNMADTLIAIIMSDPDMELVYTHCYEGRKFTLYTKEVRKLLGDVPITTIDVITWLREYIAEGLEEITHPDGTETPGGCYDSDGNICGFDDVE